MSIHQPELIRQHPDINMFTMSASFAARIAADSKPYRMTVMFDPMVGDKPKRSMRTIVEETLKLFPTVSYADVMGPRTLRRIVDARKRCMYEVYRQRPDQSFPQIGRFFGGKTHATIIWAVKNMQAEVEHDPDAVAYVEHRLQKVKCYTDARRAQAKQAFIDGSAP